MKDSDIEDGGKGLFATRELPKGQRVTYYSSKNIDETPNPKSDYVLQVSNRRFLDSKAKLAVQEFKKNGEVFPRLFEVLVKELLNNFST